jgi:hypothetical protein
VAELYERVMRSGGSSPPSGLASYFEQTFLSHPWADPEIPCLVYEAKDGQIVAFIGAHVRRIRFDGREARLVYAGQLVSEPAARRRGAGTVLCRDLLAGPQTLTMTDGATPTVAAIWEPLGGETAFLSSIVWTRVFRPGRAVRDRLRARERRRRWSALARPLLAVLDAGSRRPMRPSLPDRLDPPQELSVATLLEHAQEAAAGARLRVDYDEAFLTWLLGEMAAVRTRGELIRREVRRGGRLIGWYVAYLKPGGIGQVMQIATTDGAVDSVLDQLFAEAWTSGTAALQGRLEPPLFEPVSRRRCLLRHGERVLLHSRKPEVREAVAAGGAALSRMDGEWWMGHHTEHF